jgi:hypothetical protein
MREGGNTFFQRLKPLSFFASINLFLPSTGVAASLSRAPVQTAAGAAAESGRILVEVWSSLIVIWCVRPEQHSDLVQRSKARSGWLTKERVQWYEVAARREGT